MSSYLNVGGIHVYLITTKRSFIENSKHLEANTQAMMALKMTLNNDYLLRVANCDSVFAVWNMLISVEDQALNDIGRESSKDYSDQSCFMV